MKWYESGKDFKETSNQVELQINHVRIKHSQPVLAIITI